MPPAANSPDQNCAPGRKGGRRFLSESCLKRALLISVAITLVTGILHLLNLVDSGRAGFGPTMITFFRASSVISWILLIAVWAAGKRLPRPDRFDAAMRLLPLNVGVQRVFPTET